MRHAALVGLLLVAAVIAQKPRIIVSTDIGGDDPDDFQSMVHYLVYADIVETEGLIASPPKAGTKKDILAVIDAYEQDYANLKSYSSDYPTPDALRGITKQGAQLAQSGTTPGTPNDGSRHIVSCAKKADSRPLWILVWGSLTDVALALEEDPSIKSKIRIHSIGSWNTTVGDPNARKYLANTFKDLWWIENDKTFRGMMSSYEGDKAVAYKAETFLNANIKGHGALGDFYMAKQSWLKMGDTPSFLYLLSPLVGGVGNDDNPTAESWGGQYAKSTALGPTYWIDKGDAATSAKTVSKWRSAYEADWAKRMDRCKQPKSGGTDTSPPSKVGGLKSSAVGKNTMTLSWDAAVDGESGVASYVVYRAGSVAATVTTRTFTQSNLSAATTYEYQVAAVNSAGLEGTKSDALPVTTLGDVDATPPTVQSVTAPNATTLVVVFSEAVESVSATTKAHYTLSGGIGVVSANLASDGRTVTLKLSPALVSATAYTVNVSNVKDIAASPNTMVSVQKNVTYTAPSGIELTNLKVSSNKSYVWGTLVKGAPLYIDRTFAYDSIPPAYAGLRYLQTANTDKTLSGSSLISFDVNTSVCVSVLYDKRITTLPVWLQSFAATGKEITSDNAVTYSVFQKPFEAGPVQLGANEGGNNNMYTVVVSPCDITAVRSLSVPAQHDSALPLLSVGANGMLVFNHAISGTLRVELLDPSGRVLRRWVVSGTPALSLDNIKPGVALVRVVSGHAEQVQRVVIR